MGMIPINFNTTTMKESIKIELLQHIAESKEDGLITHDQIFNQTYYKVYNHDAKEWLKNHELDVFEAMEICYAYETNHYGEHSPRRFTGYVELVNCLVYWYGLELHDVHED
jgi:hypothetical protein